MLWAQRFEIRREGEGRSVAGAGHEVCVAMCGRDCVQQSQPKDTLVVVAFPLPAAVQPQKFKFAQLKLNWEKDAAEVLLGSRVLLLLLIAVEWSSSPDDQHQDQDKLVCVNWTNVPLCVDVLTSECRKNDTNCSTLFDDSSQRERERKRDKYGEREREGDSKRLKCGHSLPQESYAMAFFFLHFLKKFKKE